MEDTIEPAKLKAATTYNAAADHFDDGPLAFWDRYGRRTIEQLQLGPGSVVLDVGCGSGASAIPAAKVVGPQGRVIGVDLADRLLAQAVSQLLTDSGIQQAEITAEDGQQVLQSPDEWWTVVQGSGYRWTLEQMDDETIALVRDMNLEALRDNETKSIETNVIYATATKTAACSGGVRPAPMIVSWTKAPPQHSNRQNEPCHVLLRHGDVVPHHVALSNPS